MKVLELVLKVLKPQISFLEYRMIEGLIHDNSETEYEYYGNSTDWKIEYIKLSDLYEAYEKDAANNKGKLPVVKCIGVEPMPGKHGTNYKPKFTIEKWIDRPTEFDAAAPAQAAPVKAAPAPVANTVSEF